MANVAGQQSIKCKVAECLHWANGDNCDLQEIWVQKSSSKGSGLSNAVGGSSPLQERDTFCASFDPKH